MVRGRDLGLALALSALSLAAYVRTLAPSVLPADSGEFQLAAPLLGVAHPTGYPLFLLAGWLFSHLAPVGDPAFRISLLSALFSAATVGVVYLAGLELGMKRLAAGIRFDNQADSSRVRKGIRELGTRDAVASPLSRIALSRTAIARDKEPIVAQRT